MFKAAKLQDFDVTQALIYTTSNGKITGVAVSQVTTN
jgi:hypothetical protein